jgi:arabinan endo-1,5-alpha-L-arabinosidase
MAACCGACGQAIAPMPQALSLSGDVRGAHDPAVAEENGVFYVFATGIATEERPVPGTDRTRLPQLPIRCSNDLHHWQRCGAVFAEVPEWVRTLSPQTRELWAPDVSYFGGVFHLYYAFSVFGKNLSGIGLATNDTLDPASPRYRWVDRGLVLQSKAADDFNAIDPSVVLAEGQAWLSFGSFWTGIKMRRLEMKTGMLSGENAKLYSLAARDGESNAIEAPFVLEHDGWFYLFVSWDLCCKGATSTYQERVGRSRSVTGPYVDRAGRPMLRGGGTQVLRANAAWVGPGGASLLHTKSGDVMVFHAYGARDGAASLQVASVVWRDGWPVVRW